MHLFVKQIRESENYKKISSSIFSGKGPVALFGLSRTARAAYIACISEETNRPVLVVTRDEREAARLREDISFFCPQTGLFPSRDLMLRPVEGFSREYEYRRIDILGRIVGKRIKIAVASAEAAFMRTIPKENFIANTLTVKDTDTLDMDFLKARLINAGYARREMVEGPGQFAIRGDIIDIYSPDMEYPARIELWGDTIDRINIFDTETQRRIKQIKKIHISPVKEVLFSDCVRAAQKIRNYGKRLSQKNRISWERVTQVDLRSLDEDIMPRSMDKYIKICYQKESVLADYFDNPVIFFDNWSAVRENYGSLLSRIQDEAESLMGEGVLAGEMSGFYAPVTRLQQVARDCPSVLREDFMRNMGDIPLSAAVNIPCSPTSGWRGDYRPLLDDLKNLTQRGYAVAVLAGTKKYAATLSEELIADGISALYADKEQQVFYGSVTVTPGKTGSGFELPTEKLCLITGQRRETPVKKPLKRKGRDAILSVEELSKGDYVVHTNYGIGVYDGIHTVTMQGVTKDYLLIKFAGKDSLYVPVTQLDMLSRYSYSGDEEKVKLSKLGGESWNKTKRRARKATEEMAKELIDLYAEREKSKGFAFDPDTEWQKDFEAKFPFEETEDQLKAIAEIKRDMEKPRPMDRLLCGDVGVGKTEVALRAAFKAVMSGKQVAILAPTTVLARQHYNTMLRRMEGFPVNIQMLSRFRSPGQRKETLKDISTGVADIVVGTHALIQNKVQFKNLGLLVIDEEQRFGVAHKEKLVESFVGVDVLSLSATPIPRTLSMALNGIRDMSSIEQPPIDRVPVETFVAEYNEAAVAAALTRELNRGGRCYYLHNRIRSIDACADRVKRMVPGARVGIAHGQMEEEALSRVWQQLVNGDIDILVCTTIIETGVDVPNCNTLIVEDADNLGLAQLYQVRGRVGRSSRKAYAYFTFRRDKVLSEVSVKRLNAIKEFTSFGSGFRIAMRDLQIRGAGSILGKVQSGFMTSVGYDLYIKLLNQAVAVQKGERIKTEKSDCSIDIFADAYIPESYISSTKNRIEAYKKIASIETEEDVSDLLDELVDRYGDVPSRVMGLVTVSSLRSRAATLGIKEISQRKDTIVFYGDGYREIDMVRVLNQSPYRLSVNRQGRRYISAQVPVGKESLEVTDDIVQILERNKVSS